MTTKRLAFDDPKWTKADLLARVRAHRKADELIHGRYWEGGRGCAVGCMAHTGDDPHGVLADRYGIDERLFRLCDVIFEGLEEGRSLAWPERFVSTIREGADTSLLWHQFAAWLLGDSGLPRVTNENRGAIERVVNLHRRAASGDRIDKQEWLASSAEALTLVASAEVASAEALALAAAVASASLAGSTASLAAESAESAAWRKMADKLVELLEAC